MRYLRDHQDGVGISAVSSQYAKQLMLNDPLFDGPGGDGAPAPYEATQTPGDLLFVPGGAPHHAPPAGVACETLGEGAAQGLARLRAEADLMLFDADDYLAWVNKRAIRSPSSGSADRNGAC